MGKMNGVDVLRARQIKRVESMKNKSGEHGDAYKRVKEEGWKGVSPYSKFSLKADCNLAHVGGVALGCEKATAVDIFLKIFTSDVIEQLVRLVGHRSICAKDIYGFIAMRCLLQGRRKPELANARNEVLQKEYTLLKREKDAALGLASKNGRTGIPGVNLFKKYMTEGLISSQMASTTLSDRMVALISPGKHVSLDEKARKHFVGTSLYKRAPKTAEKHCFWISQLCCKMEGTKLPITLGFYPFFAPKEDVSVESIGTVWKWVQRLLLRCESKAIVCADAFFTSPSQVDLCKALELRWVGTLDSAKFPSLASLIRLVDPYDYVVLNNERNGCMFSYYKPFGDPRCRGYTMGNVFSLKGARNLEPPLPFIADEYSAMQDCCEMFNGMVGRTWWPYGRRSWNKHVDTFFFTSLLLNCYHIWRSVGEIETKESVSFDEFTIKLGDELLLWLKDQ